MSVEAEATVGSKAETDLRPVEREEWSYSRTVGVGPLRFGMTLDEVLNAAEAFGRTKVSDCPRDHTTFAPTGKVAVFRRKVAP